MTTLICVIFEKFGNVIPLWFLLAYCSQHVNITINHRLSHLQITHVNDANRK